jgi:hypothetical protein
MACQVTGFAMTVLITFIIQQTALIWYTVCIGLGQPPPAPVPIPELSAAEERNEARSWRSVVVAGLERRIDMKVIEPYKRVSFTLLNLLVAITFF